MLPFIVLCAATLAEPQPGVAVCVARDEVVDDGLDEAAVVNAWAVRQAVGEVSGALATVRDLSECPPGVRLVVSADDPSAIRFAPSLAGWELGWRISVVDLTQGARARALTEAMAAALATIDAQKMSVTEPVARPVKPDEDRTPATAPEPPRRWRSALALGARLSSGPSTQRVQYGGDLSLMFAHASSGFTAGLRVGGSPPSAQTGAVPADLWTVEAEAFAGWQSDPAATLGVRLTAGFGGAWRGLSAQPPTRLDVVSVQSADPFFTSEAAFIWRFADAGELDAGLIGRFVPGATTHVLGGAVVSETATATIGGAVRLLWWFD